MHSMYSRFEYFYQSLLIFKVSVFKRAVSIGRAPSFSTLAEPSVPLVWFWRSGIVVTRMG